MIYVFYVCIFFCLNMFAENRDNCGLSQKKAQQFVEQQVAELEKRLHINLAQDKKRSIAYYVIIRELLNLKEMMTHVTPRSATYLPLTRKALAVFAQKHGLTDELFEFAQQTNLTMVLQD